MENKIAYEILTAISQPVILVNAVYDVVFINNQAKEILELNTYKDWHLKLGQILNCHNSLNIRDCSTTIFCSKCGFNKTIEHVLLNKKPLSNQTGTIYTSSTFGELLWRLTFDANYVDIENGTVLITIKSAFKEKKLSSEPVYSQNNIIERQLQSPQLIETEACFNSLFNKSSDGLIILNKAHEITKQNNKIAEIFGLKNNGTTATIEEHFNLKHLNDGYFSTINWLQFKELFNKNQTLEGNFTTCTGIEKWLKLEIILFHDIEQEYIGSLIVIKDLSGEQLIKDQMETHQLALEFSPSEFYYLNSNGILLYANKNAREITGITITENSNLHISSINQNATQEWWHEQIKKLNFKSFIEFETTHLNTDNIEYSVFVTIFMPDPQRKNMFCYYCRNITNQKKIAKHLLKESHVNQSMAEISRELTLQKNLYSVEILVRQYSLEITESAFAFLAYRDPLTDELKTTIYSDNTENYSATVQNIADFLSTSKTTPNRSSTDLISNDTTTFLIKETPLSELLPFNNFASAGIYFNNEYKGIIFVAGNKNDYTEDDTENMQNLANLFAVAINRIKENNKLIESMDQLAMAMDVANMVVWDAYPTKDEIKITEKWLNALGLNNNSNIVLAEIVKKIHPEDIRSVTKAIIAHKNSNSPIFKVQFRIILKNNSHVWVESTGRIVNVSSSGKINRIIGVGVDISEQVKMNQDLLQSKEEAVAANKAKSAFLARISHEIRTPLNAIIGFADVLKNNSTDPLQLDYLSSIKKSGVTLMSLITDILDYSKIEAGKLTLQKNPANIVNLANETAKLFLQSTINKKLEFKTSISKNIPELILLDELQLKQIFTNLLGNAVKFTEKGFVEFKMEASPIVNNATDITFAITDTGIGIKTESQKTIFDDFTQQEDQDTRRYGGTGLGLGIVKRLVELMNGKIILKSDPGIGSTFTCTLYNCEVVERKTISENTQKTENSTTSEDENNTHTSTIEEVISDECYKACHDFKNEWNKFYFRPSFSEVNTISTQISEIAKLHKDATLLSIAQELKSSAMAFDVENLNKCINDYNYYTKKRTV